MSTTAIWIIIELPESERLLALGVSSLANGRMATHSQWSFRWARLRSKAKRQFIGCARDLTQRQDRERLLHEVQSELVHISRLSTMGEMASALAHELNQPLSAVANYLQGSRPTPSQNIPDDRTSTIMAGDGQGCRAGYSGRASHSPLA